MANVFRKQFFDRAFTLNQKFILPFTRGEILLVKVLELDFFDNSNTNGDRKLKPTNMSTGCCRRDTEIQFKTKKFSSIILTNLPIKQVVIPPLIDPESYFRIIGIPGLKEEFFDRLEDVFESRTMSLKKLRKSKIKHTKGIMLTGPVSVNKCLIAREIGFMLNTKNVKIINCNEFLHKTRVECSSKIHELFAEVEAAQKKVRTFKNY